MNKRMEMSFQDGKYTDKKLGRERRRAVLSDLARKTCRQFLF